MDVGKRLKSLRQELGLSQIEFAKHLRLSKQTVCNYETGKREPGIDFLVATADFFNVSIDYLAGRSAYRNADAEMKGIQVKKELPELIKKVHLKLLEFPQYINLLCTIAVLPNNRIISRNFGIEPPSEKLDYNNRVILAASQTFCDITFQLYDELHGIFVRK